MGCGVLIQDRERQDVATRAHTDVFMASPEARYHTPVAVDRSESHVLDEFQFHVQAGTFSPQPRDLSMFQLGKVRLDGTAVG